MTDMFCCREYELINKSLLMHHLIFIECTVEESRGKRTNIDAM